MQKLNNKSSINAITILATICNYTHEKKGINEFRRKKKLCHSIFVFKWVWEFSHKITTYFVVCHISLKKKKMMQMDSCKRIVSAKFSSQLINQFYMGISLKLFVINGKHQPRRWCLIRFLYELMKHCENFSILWAQQIFGQLNISFFTNQEYLWSSI